MLKDMADKGERATGRKSATREHLTLPDIGISRKQSSNWQKIAEIPEAEFEQDIVEAKEKTAVLTTSYMVQKVKEKEREQAKKEKADKIQASGEAKEGGFCKPELSFFKDKQILV